MKMFALLCLAACLAAAAGPAHAVPQDRRGDQAAAREGRAQGKLLPMRAIEARVVPQMEKRGYRYMGFDYDPATSIYTLKFMRNGTLIWVNVDGRTGHVISKTGG